MTTEESKFTNNAFGKYGNSSGARLHTDVSFFNINARDADKILKLEEKKQHDSHWSQIEITVYCVRN